MDVDTVAVLVVGAGPAGSTCAWQLRRSAPWPGCCTAWKRGQRQSRGPVLQVGLAMR